MTIIHLYLETESGKEDSLLEFQGKFKNVFRALSNIYQRAFCENG